MLRTLAVALAAAAGGCGGAGMAPVEGVVTFDGKPLANATVIFQPTDPDGRDANGTTDADGRFRLSTSAPGDGAVAGTYKVVIHHSPPPAVPVKQYASAEEAMAAADDPRQKPKSVSAVPAKYTRRDQTPFEVQVPPTGPVTLDLKKE